MPYLGFAEYGGVEILNEARTYAYSQRSGLGMMCEPCDGLLPALGSPSYSTPKGDRAPWYDPHFPESQRVIGFLGMDMVGFGGTGVRNPTEAVGDGSVIGPLRMAHREIHITLAVLALDHCALVYALGWLSHVLRGNSCQNNECSGLTFCLYACCPQDDNGDTPGQRSRYMRHFMDVGLLEGPNQISLTGGQTGGSGGDSSLTAGGSGGTSGSGTVTQISGGATAGCQGFGGARGGAAVATGIEFSIVAGKPWAYADSIRVVDWAKFVKGSKVTTFDPDKQREDCAQQQREGPKCEDNPHCPFPAAVPKVPVPVDRCYPARPYGAWRTIKTVSPLGIPRQAEGVPYINIETGSQPLENTLFRFYQNLQGRDCTQNRIDPCSACAELFIPWLPSNASIQIDGRSQKAYSRCRQKDPRQRFVTTTQRIALIGPGGTSFQWPVFPCGTGFCIEIVTSQQVTVKNASGANVRVNIDPQAEFSVGYVARFDST
ncbi:hypothetical protein [Streptomyces violaceusniger]|uniref:Uncharacterized protein n=1 Tax=Streptomyces violaceusniger (strain Tu 4113) TaxID=653045 RepID=G2PHE4_STRV4|nr:hypothetical protein [Streptomyces violaceusniger]AEM88790.1 hypothetical protein Strvi_0013 [Streptomyces violaceusniger Tu 4113]